MPSRRSITAFWLRRSRRLQQICDGLSAEKIDGLLRKWLRLLPHPFTGTDRAAGYRYDISILQAEFSLTHVLDRPVHGRLFFEQVIRENLDLGRPEEVQLIFNRKITRRTPGSFRTRVLTQDVTPSLNVYYKNTRIKQYHKENRRYAPRPPSTTPTTSASANACTISPSCARSALRPIAGSSNRTFQPRLHARRRYLPEHQQPGRSRPQRASGLRFADPRVHQLCKPSFCSARSHKAFVATIYATILPPYPAATQKQSPKAPSLINCAACVSTACRTSAQQLSLSRHRISASASRYSSPALTTAPAPGTAAAIPTLRAINPNQKSLRQNRRQPQLCQSSPTRPIKLDTFTPSVVT